MDELYVFLACLGLGGGLMPTCGRAPAGLCRAVLAAAVTFFARDFGRFFIAMPPGPQLICASAKKSTMRIHGQIFGGLESEYMP